MIIGEKMFGGYMKKENKLSQAVGSYTYFPYCRFCFHKIIPVIDLGFMPLAGGFLKKKSQITNEKTYPLSIGFCQSCYLLQCDASIQPDTLFKEYFYFSSSIKSLVTHFTVEVEKLTKRFPDPSKKVIVEIGCNDGVFLRELLKKHFTAVGVDPAINVITPLLKEGLPVLNEYFTRKSAKKIMKKNGRADAIFSYHAMAHIEDMHEVIKGISLLLKDDGFLAFEVHYLGDLLTTLQYDMMYHEHQYYYTLLSLQNFFAMYNMEIFDVARSDIRAGSIMYYVQKSGAGKQRITENVRQLERQERKQGLDTIATYKQFAKKIKKTKKELQTIVIKLKKQKKTIAGYGASGRGTIIMNYCGLTKDFLDYVIDDAPAKHGSLTPGTHLKIRDASILETKQKPDYLVLFAWPFFEEVKKKNTKYLASGGKFIVPLPELKIIS